MLLIIGAVQGGCKSNARIADESDQRKMLELLMPSRIQIVQPFTRVKSFDDDNEPDGIEVLLQAVNALDNPGLMIAGDVRVELYRHIPASGNRRGQRLESWSIMIANPADQRAYWNEITQMYQFRLGMNAKGIPRDDKYVLQVTYNSPLGQHLTDECIVERPSATLPLGTPR
jgi:hypothetical protein